MKKFVRVMDGLKSNAGGFEYKLDEVNISNHWDPTTIDPEKQGGFNFCSEDKILRWLHRGDTIYDVIIPDDAEVIEVDKDKGIFRSNKIIVTNPRKLTDELIIDLYKENTLSDERLAQSLQVLLWKDKMNIVKYIIEDKVNESNVEEILTSFGNYSCNGDFSYDKLGEKSKEVYDLLKSKQESKKR